MRALLLPFVLALAAGSVSAGESLHVELRGVVLVNQAQFIVADPIGSAAAGQSVVLSFQIDSDAFLPSPDGTSRAYAVDPASFELVFEPGSTRLKRPSTRRPPWFVLTDGAAGDGVRLSEHVDASVPLTLDAHGVLSHFGQYLELGFEAAEFPSSDALALLGTHDATAILAAQWEYEDLVFIPLVITFETLTIARAGAHPPSTFVGPPAPRAG